MLYSFHAYLMEQQQKKAGLHYLLVNFIYKLIFAKFALFEMECKPQNSVMSKPVNSLPGRLSWFCVYLVLNLKRLGIKV